MKEFITFIAMAAIPAVVYFTSLQTSNPILYAISIMIMIIAISAKFIIDEIKNLKK